MIYYSQEDNDETYFITEIPIDFRVPNGKAIWQKRSPKATISEIIEDRDRGDEESYMQREGAVADKMVDKSIVTSCMEDIFQNRRHKEKPVESCDDHERGEKDERRSIQETGTRKESRRFVERSVQHSRRKDVKNQN